MSKANMFLKLDGVESESTDDKHKGEIELESFSWGVTNQHSNSIGEGSGGGQGTPHTLQCTKQLDKSSPLLMVRCATGKGFETAVLTVRRGGADAPQDYFKITLEKAWVCNYQVTAHSGAAVPSESFDLKVKSIELSYRPLKGDGSLGGEVKQKYNFADSKNG